MVLFCKALFMLTNCVLKILSDFPHLNPMSPFNDSLSLLILKLFINFNQQ
ncbi:hypothetical protein GLYMA_15G064650v4 [Glycine max]|nr:hypothetical protein GLYMA_15G064650v4 [Glycine max]KAH1145881.1 hypothetical protein GYH30_041536 [Glycine max]